MQYQTHGLFKQKRHGNITTEEKKSFMCVNQQRPEFKQENKLIVIEKHFFFVVALSPELRALFRCYYV